MKVCSANKGPRKSSVQVKRNIQRVSSSLVHMLHLAYLILIQVKSLFPTVNSTWWRGGIQRSGRRQSLLYSDKTISHNCLLQKKRGKIKTHLWFENEADPPVWSLDWDSRPRWGCVMLCSPQWDTLFYTCLQIHRPETSAAPHWGP